MDEEKKVCGIVMPISEIDGCPESHWADVLAIITNAVEDAGFEANIVSNADDVGIIQKRIIQNLYDNPIVVCDVSGKNPNVMFELGMRLAFDKPTVIVKDEKTDYSFDTSPIEHLEYPRDLRFSRIVDFKRKLADKVLATYSKSQSDPDYTAFLKHFGEFKVAKIDKKEVTEQQYLLEELKTIKNSIARLERYPLRPRPSYSRPDPESFIDVPTPNLRKESVSLILRHLNRHPAIASAAHHRSTEGSNFRIHLYSLFPLEVAEIKQLVRSLILEYGGTEGELGLTDDELSDG